MGLATLASTLYSIQSRKNVPLRTAFSMMVREDIATRFSVFSLAKYITKSEFLATLAHAKFGGMTPMQKAERKEKEKEYAVEKKQQQRLEKFQRFTAGSIAGLNNKINMLAAITEKNTGLINSLYNEIGYFKNQRSININNVNPKSIRAPVAQRRVKNQIDDINKKIQELQATKLKPSKKPAEKKKLKKEIKESGMLDSILDSIMKNPLFLLSLTRGVGKAIGIGGLAAQVASILNLPKTAGEISQRLSGKDVYDDPLTEKIGQYKTLALGTVGAYTAVRGATAIGSRIKNSLNNKNPNYARDKRMNDMNKMTKGFQKRGMSYKEAQSKAGARYKKISGASKFLKKWSKLSKVLNVAAKRLPGIAVADVVFEMARISNYVADHANGRMNDAEFKTKVSYSLTEISSTVGFSALGGIIGSVVGTGLFPGVGTVLGGLIGAGAGVIASVLVPEESMEEVGTKLFELLFQDKATSKTQSASTTAMMTSSGSKPSSAASAYSKPAGEFAPTGASGGMPLKAIPADTQKILETIRKRESSGNYKAVTSASSASGAYQFLDGTWRERAKAAGIGTEYPSAYLAPPQIQDAVAAHYVESILKQPDVNGDVSKIPLVWFTGNAQGKRSAAGDAANPTVSVAQYQANWMKAYADSKPSATASMRTPDVSPPPARASTNTPVAMPPDASAAEEKTADNKAAENAQVNAIAAVQSVSRLQQQVNAVSTETVRMRQKMLDDGEFPSAVNSDMERYA